jgi:hypothetical protein
MSSARPISGLSLWNRLEQILRNCKKAAAFAKEKLKPDGSFDSGNSADDLWDHVLDKMYEYLKSQGEDGEDDYDNDDNNDGDCFQSSHYQNYPFLLYVQFVPHLQWSIKQ